MTVIIGIDPGSRVTGYGVVRMARQRAEFIACGSIRLDADALDQRLLVLFDELSLILAEFHPTEAAIERVFMNRNVDSALKLGHARGVAILAARKAGNAVYEYSATQTKQAIVGRGHADKAQVQHMVKALLGLDATPGTDAADALAAAICHGHTRTSLAHLARAGARS